MRLAAQPLFLLVLGVTLLMACGDDGNPTSRQTEPTSNPTQDLATPTPSANASGVSFATPTPTTIPIAPKRASPTTLSGIKDVCQGRRDNVPAGRSKTVPLNATL